MLLCLKNNLESRSNHYQLVINSTNTCLLSETANFFQTAVPHFVIDILTQVN